MKDINIIFSDNLKYWLEQRGKTQADLYRKLDVSSATASDWCNNKKMPRADKLVEIAEWLMIEISDLIEDKKREPNQLDQLVFRLKDDAEFFTLVFDLSKLPADKYEKAADYIELLKK